MIDKEQFLKDIKNDLGIQERENTEYVFDKENNFDDLEKIFFEAQQNEKFKERSDYNPQNNITIKYKLKSEEMKNGCKKEIKYFSRDYDFKKKKDKLILRKYDFKFPENLKSGQKIIIRGEGKRNQKGNGDLHIIIK